VDRFPLTFQRTGSEVRARVLAISTLVFQGAVAAGSAPWGVVAAHYGIGPAMLCAGVGTIATTALAPFLRLPDTAVDLSSWNHWRLPAADGHALPTSDDFGPVLVTVEYQVAAEEAEEFLAAVRQHGRIRRRDGARRWGIFRDMENMRISMSKPSMSLLGPSIFADTSG
jgi:Transmembrane secretion effector